MPLTSSGQIDLNAMHVEAGGTTGTECTLNDTDIRGMISKASGAQMAFNEWYGASSYTVYSFTGSDYIPLNTNQKTESARMIRFYSQTGASNAFSNALTFTGGNTASSYSNHIWYLYDAYNGVFANYGASLQLGHTWNGSSWIPCFAADFGWVTGVYAKFYYSNSLIATWSYLKDDPNGGLSDQFGIYSSSSGGTSIIGSRTTASAWTVEIYVP